MLITTRVQVLITERGGGGTVLSIGTHDHILSAVRQLPPCDGWVPGKDRTMLLYGQKPIRKGMTLHQLGLGASCHSIMFHLLGPGLAGGSPELWSAVKTGDTPLVTELLQRGADVNWSPDSHFSMLYMATVCSNLPIARLLVQSGADVQHPSREVKYTPLHIASVNGCMEIVELLLGAGASPLVVDEKGDTPLHAAALGSAVEVAQGLLRAGANPRAANKMGWSPLHVAAAYDRVTIARLLLRCGGDVEQADNKGNTSMGLAASRDRVEMVQLMLSSNANPMTANQAGDTPLHAASAHIQVEVALLLLGAGANPFASNKDGNTPQSIVGRAVREEWGDDEADRAAATARRTEMGLLLSDAQEEWMRPWSRFRHGSWRPAERQGVLAVTILLLCRGLPRANARGPPLVLVREVVEEHVLPMLSREDYEALAYLGYSSRPYANAVMPPDGGGSVAVAAAAASAVSTATDDDCGGAGESSAAVGRSEDDAGCSEVDSAAGPPKLKRKREDRSEYTIF